MSLSLSKKDVLRKKKTIDLLFSEGASISSFPVRFVYMKGEKKEVSSLEVGFSVPKRNIKLASERNRLKRKLREAYRLEKKRFLVNDFCGYGFFIYTSKKKKDEEKITQAIEAILQKWAVATSL
jgi:ribonuclease P protein component